MEYHAWLSAWDKHMKMEKNVANVLVLISTIVVPVTWIVWVNLTAVLVACVSMIVVYLMVMYILNSLRPSNRG